jgi:hypothetical protein
MLKAEIRWELDRMKLPEADGPEFAPLLRPE